LKDLESLILCQNNGLNGTLDPLRGLTKLTNLNVGANKLTGPVDPLYNLRSLRTLSVAYNRLTGILDSGFRRANMPNLTEFNAATNMFTALPSNNVEWSRFTRGCSLHRQNFTCSTSMAIPAQAKAHCGATCCVGSSADLVAGDCDAWQNFTRDPVYTKWAEGKCGGAKVHTDPCSCSFGSSKVLCTNGRITALIMAHQGLPGRGGVPSALMGLTGLSRLGLDGNGLNGSIPNAIGKLTGLIYLDLSNNQLTGTVPTELVGLKQLAVLGLQYNTQLTGLLPGFNFTQISMCCRMDKDVFTCPLPVGAVKCTGGPLCGGPTGTHVFPPPICM
jgi:Leucine-rich repeat (LRR) protein